VAVASDQKAAATVVVARAVERAVATVEAMAVEMVAVTAEAAPPATHVDACETDNAHVSDEGSAWSPHQRSCRRQKLCER